MLVQPTRKGSNIHRVELKGCHSGELSTINWPNYKNDLNNPEITNSNISKTNEYNLKKDSLTSFINKYDNIMVLAGAGSSIAKFDESQQKSYISYSKNRFGLYQYKIAESINNELNDSSYYNLYKMADISHFYGSKKLDRQKKLIHKYKINNGKLNERKILLFSNFNLFILIIRSFNYFLYSKLINLDDNTRIKYESTVKKINKLLISKNKQHKETINKHVKSGLPVALLAKRINQELNTINQELGYEKYYNLLTLAHKFNFDNINSMKNKNKVSKLVFNNFEDLSSEINEFNNFIDLSKKFHKKIYTDTTREIHKLIRNYCSLQLNNKYFDHFNFIHKLQLLNNDNNRLKIYSTNYDTLFEQAADKNNSIIIDGFDYSSKRKFNNDAMNIDFINKQNDNRQINISNSNIHRNVIKLFQLHGSTDWYRTSNGVYKTTTHIANKKINSGEGETCMIFPSSRKYAQTYKDPYFDLFFNFQRDLHEENTLLIVVGFSFGDMHIRRMVYDAMISNKSLSMIFVTHGGVKGFTKNGNIHITDSNLNEFFNSSLLSRELFFKGDLDDFTDAIDLTAIHNK